VLLHFVTTFSIIAVKNNCKAFLLSHSISCFKLVCPSRSSLSVFLRKEFKRHGELIKFEDFKYAARKLTLIKN